MKSRYWLLALAVLVSGPFAHLARASEPTVTLEIKSQPLRDALSEFGRQSGLQVVFVQTDVDAAIMSSALEGTFSADVALGRLLANTALGYEFINPRTVAIRLKSGESVKNKEPTALAGNDSATLRLAQAETAAPGSETTDPNAASPEKGAPSEGLGELTLEEVVVTGTHIRGVAPPGSPLKVYSRADIDKSGAATLEQFARQMPENFSNIDSVANTNSTSSIFGAFTYAFNAFDGAAFNLRGVGPSATLTLLNGHRLSSGGFDGGIVDISQIPLSAVDHIEVLTDGASATYGADAVAGVVNIVTKRDFRGAETGVRYADASDGGAVQFTGSQLLGGSWSGGSAFLTYEYDDQDGLDVSRRDYLPDQGGPYSLLPQNRRNSALFSARQEIGAGFAISGDAIYSKRDSANSATQLDFLNISDSEVEQRGINLALERALVGDWRASLTGNRSELEQRNDTVGNGSFVSIAALNAESDVTEAALMLNGSAGVAPGGKIRAAVGASFGEQRYEAANRATFIIDPFPPFSSETLVPAHRRHVTSAYGELLVPLITHLEISAAVRFDDYSDFGSTTNPKLGISWQPAGGLTLRGTYGTSFKAPLLYQLYNPIQATAGLFQDDPLTPEQDNVLTLQGGNPQLDAEESTSFTLGFDLVPTSAPQFSVGVTYFHIDYDGKISFPPFIGTNPYLDPGVAPFFNRSPTLSEVEAIFNDPNIIVSDQAGEGAAGVDAIFDIRQANIASTKQAGVDLSAGYSLQTDRGSLDLSLDVSRLLKNDYQDVASSPVLALLNDFGQPPKWKGRAGISWSRGALAVAAFVSHVNSYDNSLSATGERIDSWTTADINISYRTGKNASLALLQGLTLALNVSNLTNEEPPFVDLPVIIPGLIALPFDAANASPVGRRVSLAVTKHW